MAYREYMAGRQVVLSVAPTAPERLGTDATLPVSPEAIATQVTESESMGASIASVYGWTEDGEPTAAALPDVAAAIRERAPEMLVEYAFAPSYQLGDYLDAIERRSRPDFAQVPLTPGQYGSREVTALSRRDVDRLVEAVTERGIKPNCLLRSGRDVQELHRLLANDLLSAPVVTLRLGARDGAVATPLTLMSLLQALPTSANVLVAATGPNQYPITTMALFMGAHARVGMADNRYLALEEPVERNIQLVQRVAETVSHSRRSFADAAATMDVFSLDGHRAQQS